MKIIYKIWKKIIMKVQVFQLIIIFILDILDNYEKLYESNNNLTIEEENAMLPEANNKKKIPDLLSKYSKIFAKFKYEVSKIKMELPKLYLTSKLLISLRAYRSSF